MKTNTILWITGIIGIIVGGLCVFFVNFCLNLSWWEAFDRVGAVLGYIANLTIVAALVKYTTSETLNINGIGKFKIKRMENNIQDLTNLISWKFYKGKNFHRNPLLEEFYKNSSIEIIEKDPRYTEYSSDAENKKEGEEKIRIGNDCELSRSQFKNINELIEAVRWIKNNGEALDKDIMTEIYKQWYVMSGSSVN